MSLGRLVVSLTADIAEFASAIGKAAHLNQRTMRQIQHDAERAGKAFGAVFVAGLGATAALTKQAINAAEQINKMAQSAGVTTESFSALSYAANLADISTETLSTSLSRLNRNISETASGTGEAKEAFAALGITVKNADGSLKNADEVMRAIAIRFQQMEDGAGKSALAIQLFGRSGAQMIPLLNQGASGLEAMRFEAEQFGRIISGEVAQAAEDFNDNLQRLGGLSQSFGNAVMVAVLPHLNSFTDALVAASKEGNKFKDSAESLASILKFVATAGLGTAAVIETLHQLMAGWLAMLTRAATLDLAGVFFIKDDIKVQITQVWERYGKLINAVEQSKPILNEAKDNWELLGNTWKTKGPVMADKRQFEEQLVALRSFVDQYAAAIKLSNILTGEAEKQGLITHVQAIEQRMAADNAYLQTLQIQLLKQAAIYKQMGEIAKERKARDEAAAAGAAVETNAVIAQAQIATFEELERQKSAAKAKEEQKRLAEGVAAMQIEFLTEREFLAMHLQQKQEMLNAAFENQQISAQEHARLMEEIELRHRDKLGEIAAQFEVRRRQFTEMTWQQQTDTVAGAFQQMTAISGRESRKMFEINKIASLAIAIVKGWEFVMSSAAWGAAWGGVYGGIAAGSIAAAVAAANVAAISRTQFGGGQVASFAGSTPVTPVQQSGPDIARERGPDTIIQLRGDVFSREGVRKLIEQLNETTEDGGRITVV